MNEDSPYGGTPGAGSHKLWWKPGVAGRGFVLRDGSVMTWPEAEATHHERAYSLNLDPAFSFHIRPDGTVARAYQQDQPDEQTKALIEGADPRLSVNPALRLDWGGFKESHTAGPLSDGTDACPNCGATDEYQGGLCYSCGHGSKPCPRCGNETQDGWCYNCGMEVPQEVSQKELGKPQCRNCGSTDLGQSTYRGQAMYQCRACNSYTMIPGEGLNVERDVKLPIYNQEFDYGPVRQGALNRHGMVEMHYHVAPTEDRESVRQHGIDFNKRDRSRDWRDNYGEEETSQFPMGNYMTRNLGAARAYSQMSGGDIWHVNTGGLNLLPDPDHSFSEAVHTPEPIGPERIQFLEPYESRADRR